MSKHIISGGPCTGKSTLLKELKETHICYDEIARKVIAQELQIGSQALPWLDNLAFSNKVLELMKADFEKAQEHPIVFFDRGMPDLIGYMKFYKNPIPAHFLTTISETNYAKKVFFLEPWEEIYVQDKERIETFEQAQAISACLKSTYIALGFDIIPIAPSTIQERILLIEKHI